MIKIVESYGWQNSEPLIQVLYAYIILPKYPFFELSKANGLNILRLAFILAKFSFYNYSHLLLKSSILVLSAKCTILYFTQRIFL